MKTQSNQARLNAGTKSRIPQTKTANGHAPEVEVKSKFGPQFDLPKNAHISCLCIFDRENQEVVSRIPLREEEWAEIMLATVKNNSKIADFVAAAIREKLAGDSLMDTALDIEVPIQRGIALIDLMQSRLEQLEPESKPGPGQEDYDSVASKVAAGTFSAAYYIQRQLAEGFDRISAAYLKKHNIMRQTLNGKVREVAS